VQSQSGHRLGTADVLVQFHFDSALENTAKTSTYFDDYNFQNPATSWDRIISSDNARSTSLYTEIYDKCFTYNVSPTYSKYYSFNINIHHAYGISR